MWSSGDDRPFTGDLNSGRSASIEASKGEFQMLAIAIIFGFIAVIAAVNFYEFGSID